jgi:hypothetical protein
VTTTPETPSDEETQLPPTPTRAKLYSTLRRAFEENARQRCQPYNLDSDMLQAGVEACAELFAFDRSPWIARPICRGWWLHIVPGCAPALYLFDDERLGSIQIPTAKGERWRLVDEPGLCAVGACYEFSIDGSLYCEEHT